MPAKSKKTSSAKSQTSKVKKIQRVSNRGKAAEDSPSSSRPSASNDADAPPPPPPPTTRRGPRRPSRLSERRRDPGPSIRDVYPDAPQYRFLSGPPRPPPPNPAGPASEPWGENWQEGVLHRYGPRPLAETLEGEWYLGLAESLIRSARTRANAWQERLDSGEFPPGTRPDISVIDSQYRQNQGQVDLRSESHLTDEMVEFIIDAFETRYHNLRLRLVEFGLNLEIYDNMDRSTGLPRNHPGARPQLPNEQRPRPPQLHNGPYQMSRASTAELLSPVTEHPEEGPGLCSICLNRMYRLHPINETDRPVRLPCGHAFHTGCILTWWQRTPNNPGCPYCRRIYQIRWE